MLPWTADTATLPRSDASGSVRPGRRAALPRLQLPRPPSSATDARRQPAPASSSSAPESATANETQWRTGDGGQAESGRIGLRERQPTPAETAEGHATLEGLDGDRRGSHRQGPHQRTAEWTGLQALHQAERDAGQGAEERLHHGERDPRQPPDDDPRPLEERQLQGQPEGPADERGPSGAAASDRHAESRDRQWGKPPPRRPGKGAPGADACQRGHGDRDGGRQGTEGHGPTLRRGTGQAERRP